VRDTGVFTASVFTLTVPPTGIVQVRGTGVFTASAAAATAAVLSGEADAAEFRLFMGRCFDLDAR